MKINELNYIIKQIIKEEINFDVDNILLVLQKYIEDIINKPLIIKHTANTSLGKMNTLKLKSNKYPDTYFDITVDDKGEITLYLYSEHKVNKESLADPRKNYRTTSASTFKLKRYKLNNYYSDIKKAKKAIVRYFNRLNKDGIKL